MLSLPALLLEPSWPCTLWLTLVPLHGHMAQVPSWCRVLLSPPAPWEGLLFIWQLAPALPVGFQHLLWESCHPAYMPPKYLDIQRRAGRGWILKSLWWWLNLSILCPDLLAVFSFFLYLKLPNLSVSCQLLQSCILTTEIIPALKSLGFILRLPPFWFLLIGKFWKSHDWPFQPCCCFFLGSVGQ